MAKVKQADFRYFQHCINEYISIFELHNWRISFSMEDIGDPIAKIVTDPTGYIATFYLNSIWDDPVYQYTRENLKQTALHEVIHLLLMRLTGTAQARFVSKSELDEAEEEVVRKLEYMLW